MKLRFALAGGQRVEAYPGGRAMCPLCNGEVIAKCGTHRVAHWAHRGMRDCDPWAEKETDWHRAWKNNFPVECQEFIQHDEQSGEKHIADVRTPYDLVIEFQHSHLDPLERAARERFYRNMVWVVDGTRLQRDYPRFKKGKDSLRRTDIPQHFILAFPDEYFPAMWLDSSVPVIFDFRGTDESRPPDAFRDTVWCLHPGRVGGSAVVVGMSREQFVKEAPSRPQLLPVQETLAYFRDLRAANARQARPFVGMPGGRGPLRRHARF
jgi:competence protein CoiA